MPDAPSPGASVNRGTFYGYDYRGTQPCVQLSVELPLRSEGDLASVDAWLTGRISVDAETVAALPPAPPDDPEGSLSAAVARALLIYGELARGANLPCFDPGRLLSLEPVPDKPDTVTATVALPAVDNLPRRLFVELFLEALNTVRETSRAAAASKAGIRLLARLEKVVAGARAHSPFGGSSIVPVCSLAHRHGIPFRHVGGGFMRVGVGANGRLLHKSSIEDDSAIGANICLDKRVTARLLLAAGMPGAQHIPVDSREAAVAAARRLGWPVVVKPADRERAKGVTVGVRDEKALLAAYDKARDASAHVLVERHVEGTGHRILVVGETVLYAVKRIPKRLIGNGRDSIATLVEERNARHLSRAPWNLFPPHVLDALALECLAADGFTPASVLLEGQVAYVRPLATPEWGGEVDDLTKTIHPDNAELAIAATRLFGLTVAGVDLITTDIAQPWHATGAIINEMNYRPQFSIERREVDTSILARAMAHGTGRIPVHLIVGSGDLAAAAGKLGQRLAKSGCRAHVTSATATHDPDGRAMALASASLFDRSLVLAMRPDVHALIMIGAPAEVFERGLAVDRLDSLEVVDTDTGRAKQLREQLQARFLIQGTAVTAPAKKVSKARARRPRSAD